MWKVDGLVASSLKEVLQEKGIENILKNISPIFLFFFSPLQSAKLQLIQETWI